MDNINVPNNHRVLIIDDNRAIHDDFRKILSPPANDKIDEIENSLFGTDPQPPVMHRFEVDSAHQGIEGFLMVKSALEAGKPYAVAFIDVRMPPGWDGVDTAAKIWEIDPEIQIVLCTAYADYSWEEMFAKLGARDGLLILKKPFDILEASQMTHALSEKWRLRRQSQMKLDQLETIVDHRTSELRLLASAVEQSKESIMITDAEINLPGPRILFANPAFSRMTGYTEEEVLGKSPRIFQGPRTERAVLDRLRSNLEKGEVYEGETINYRKDGSEYILEWQVAPIRDPLGEVTHYVAIQRDITHRRRLEGQLIQSQKMETVGRLAGGIAHEFNSILTTILGQSESLLSELTTGSLPAQNALEIYREAARAATLTRQLLAFGRKQFLQPGVLNLNQVITEMQGVLQHLVGEGVEIRMVKDPGLQLVRVDAEQIAQVIINLAINARDAMPRGGLLVFETANALSEDEVLKERLDANGTNYVTLSITDTGDGMSEETKAHAFEPFFTTKPVGIGTGLGLSSCEGIMKQSGGHISMNSKLGSGTTFKLYLPQAIVTASPGSPTPSGLPKGNATLLLLDANLSFREMAAGLLTSLGYKVFIAADHVNALDLIEKQAVGPIDLLVTDIGESDNPSDELLYHLKLVNPDLRLIYTSSQAKSFSNGLFVLPQPFSPTALAQAVKEVLNSSVAMT